MSSDWIFWSVAGLLVIYGLALQWWAVLANRDIHGRRCPRCWYDMSGSAERRCPECGRRYRRESQLHRRPPRWKTFGIGLAMLLSAGFAAKAAKDGFAPMIPTPVLTLIAPSTLGSGGEIEKEFSRRLNLGAIKPDQFDSVVKRWLGSGPPPWTIELATRAQWPAGAPLQLAARFDTQPSGVQWIDGCTFRLRLVPRFDASNSGIPIIVKNGDLDEPFRSAHTSLFSDGRDSLAGALDWPADWRMFTTELPAPPRGVTALEFDAIVELQPPLRRGPRVTAQRRSSRPVNNQPFVTVSSSVVSVPVEVTEGVAEAMTPRALDAAMSVDEYLGLSVRASVPWGGSLDGDPMYLSVRRRLSEGVRPLDDMVVALELELRLDDRVVATSTLVWEESITLETFVAVCDVRWNEAPVSLRGLPEDQRSRWSVRGRADPSAALGLFDASSFLQFDGDLDLPINWRR